MNWIVENWYLIVAALAVILAVVIVCTKFFKLPTEEQMSAIKHWLLYAVIAAEKELGAGTGKAKLAFVYDLFLSKFPTIAHLLPFEKFSALVDDALQRMKELLASAPQLKNYIG